MDFPVNVKRYPILGMTKACEGVNTVALENTRFKKGGGALT